MQKPFDGSIITRQNPSKFTNTAFLCTDILQILTLQSQLNLFIRPSAEKPNNSAHFDIGSLELDKNDVDKTLTHRVIVHTVNTSK